ncbi:non-ribosomal peptide synthetase [Amycolatopsis sp. 195334CR]|uniref:non-ribosomal peptide synthetase n=1 Tax=Amycolatopsis sp. 195334CR TaxID=2814588 RepID=UPI001A8EC749|nr:non-ribosomal peptide synthetase [Amycolatopsis sp. 195334CR]MBN6039761.1 amino acid adenylation domain-containing protein [Amycolatopsis sp. 195334CR]
MVTGNHGRLPVSSAQRAVWLAHQQDPTERRYTCAEYLTVTGPLDLPLFRRAWAALGAEADVLRVLRVEETADGELNQVLAECVPPLHELDLPDDTAALDWMHHDLDQPIDLATGPVSRAALLRITGHRHLLYLRMHHMFTDGHSMHLMQNALADTYTALVRGQDRTTARLGGLDALIAKDEKYRASADFEADRAYWTKRFADSPEPMRVPAVLGDRDERTIRARQVSYLPAGESAPLAEAAAGLGTTWQLAVVAATAAYLHRITGRRDVVLGLAGNGRRGGRASLTPGMAANTLALRLEVSPSMTLRQLVPLVAEETAAVQRHERFRYDDLCHALGTRLAEDGPLGPILNFMPYAREFRFADATASAVNLASGPSIDLTFGVTGAAEQGLALAVDADPALHRADGLAGALRRWTAFVLAATAAPDQEFRSIELLTQAERAEVLVRRNDTARARDGRTVVDLVREVARRQPDAIALSGTGSQLTYGELEAKAGLLTARLIERGVHREDVVGLAMPRSPELIVAMLAVLRAGASYLPLDLAYPPDRLRYMVTDSAPRCVLVTDSATAAAVLPADVVMVDAGELPSGGHPAEPVALAPASAANVIYTSGSTGSPKGVVAQHQGLVNFALDHVGRFGITPDSRVLQYLSPAFDAAGEDIWPALVAGARLVLPPEPASITPAELITTLKSERITHAAVPPSVLRQLPDGDLPDLVHLVVGGEPSDDRLVGRWARDRRMMNMYGPTETSCATGGRLLPGEPVTIGGPTDNVAVYVLDGDLRPVAPGVAGELYIAGHGVARGYLNQPGLTADRFLPCPYAEPGARMYRTGDRVFQRDDGRLQFLGRTDHQVKIRGFRVELGEIEAALGSAPGVENAIVLVKGTRSGGKQLAGYALRAPGAAVDTGGLRRRLRDALPEHMVPSSILVLDSFPVLPNGKVNRDALPDPAGSGPRVIQPPATKVQAALCGMFAEVLGVAEIGVHDSFFAQGGDSILALRLVSAARAAGLVLSPRQVFEHPTVAELAEVVGRDVTAEADDGLGAFPAPPIVRWATELGPIDRFHQSVCVRVPAGAGHDRLAKVLQLVIDRHPALRTRLTDVRSLRADAPATADVLSTVDVTGLDLDAVVEEQREAAVAALCPADGSLVRAVWCNAGEDHHGTLLLVLHHLAVDGVSWRVLLDDLAHAWEVVAADGTARWAPAGTSPRTWANQLATAAAEPRWTAQAALWQRVLTTDDPPIGKRERTGTDTFDTAAATELTLPDGLAEPLLTVLPDRYRATQNDVLLTAFALAARRWRERWLPGGTAVLVDLEGHGRQDAGQPVALDNTVGWFTSIHPVAVDPGALDWPAVVSGGAELGPVLKRVKEQLRAIPDHGLGFGLLRYLNDDTARVLAPLGSPRLAFNYLGRLTVSEAADWALTGDDPFDGAADPRMVMPHELEINVLAYDRPQGTELTVRAMWPSGVLDEADVIDFLGLLRDALTGLAAHAALPGAGGMTPSDVPLVDLDQEEIDELTRDRPGTADILPLTPLQEALLLHHLVTKDTIDVYNEQLRMILEGPLDADRLRAALAAVVRRHPALAAAFDHDVAEPVQLVPADPPPVPWTEHDLSDLDPGERDLRAAHLADADRAARFRLDQPPPLRVQLVRLGPDRHQLVLTAHHIVWDGWSMAIVLREFFACYPHGDDRVLPAPPRYRNYLTWLRAQDTGAARAAWADYLAGVAGPTRVAPDLPADQVTHELLITHLPENVATRLTERAKQAGVTFNAVVQLVWAGLLGELTGEQDVIFGTSVSGRPPEIAGVHDMVGLLTNTVPVRVRLEHEAPVADALARLAREQVPLLNHHHLGLADIQRQSGHDRVTLFDTTLMVLNYPFDPAEWDAALGDLHVADHHLSDDTPYPLRLVVVPGPRVQVRLGFRPDAVSREEATALLDRVAAAFTAIAHDPGLTVAGLFARTPLVAPLDGRLEGTT